MFIASAESDIFMTGNDIYGSGSKFGVTGSEFFDTGNDLREHRKKVILQNF